MKKVELLTVCGIVLLVCVVSPVGADEGVAAVSVGDFLNSLGVCTHIGQGIDDPSRSAAALEYAGLHNIRDDGSPRHVEDWILVHRQTGVKVVLTWSGPNDHAIGSLIDMSKKLAAAGALLALEGPNEANNWAVAFEGEKSRARGTFLPVAMWQRAFYERAKSDPVLKDYPVFHASEAGGSEPDNVGLQFLTIPADANTLMPAGTKYADYANVHNYICRRPRIIDNMAWVNADPVFHGWTDGLYVEYGKTWRKGFAGYSNAELMTLPRVTTETGWVTGGSKGLTQEQQGRLYLNLYLAQFKQGFKHTFIYMLRDARGSDAGYGMFERDYRPKRSALYLHNLTRILSDEGTARPGKLDYAIPNSPETVHDLLLQKSDGTFELVVWNEKAEGTSNITVNLGTAQPSVNLYDPTIGTAPIQTFADTRSISLTLSDHPVILEVNSPRTQATNAERQVAAGGPPYLRSRVITGIEFHEDTLVRKAPGSDIWACTCDPNGTVYAAWGDGGGFGGTDSQGRASIGVARLTGRPPDWRGENLWGGQTPISSQAPTLGKGTLIAVKERLYLYISEQGKWDRCRLWRSSDQGLSWSDRGWLFPRSHKAFAFPGLVQYSGAQIAKAEGYVYGFSDNDPARVKDNYLYLFRVRQDQVEDLAAYEYFCGTIQAPRWSHNFEDRTPVFHNPAGIGWGTTCVYHSTTGRYLLAVTVHDRQGDWGLYESPHLWGPWRTVAYGEELPEWTYSPAEKDRPAYLHSFPAAWISSDGKTLWCIFDRGDHFNLAQCTLHIGHDASERDTLDKPR